MIYGGFFLIGLIPLKTSYRLADALGRIWFAFDYRHREVALANLQLAFGDRMSQAQIRSLGRSVFCNLARIIFEIGWSLHLKQEDIRKHFRFRGLDNLYSALRRNRGVLGITAHIGNWELLLTAAAGIGHPISATYRPLRFKPLDMFFSALRSRDGASLIRKKRGMRKVLHSLRNNNIVGMMLDQNSLLSEGVFAEFFGVPACTNKGAALLARKTGVPVLPVFLVRENDFFRVEFGPEMPHIKTGDKINDIEAATRNYNKVIEDIVRKYPEQWFWVHRRWKNRPYKT